MPGLFTSSVATFRKIAIFLTLAVAWQSHGQLWSACPHTGLDYCYLETDKPLCGSLARFTANGEDKVPIISSGSCHSGQSCTLCLKDSPTPLVSVFCPLRNGMDNFPVPAEQACHDPASAWSLPVFLAEKALCLRAPPPQYESRVVRQTVVLLL